jgi:hypothetical protein
MSIGKLPFKQAPKLEPSTKIFNNGYLSQRPEMARQQAIKAALKKQDIKDAVSSAVAPKEQTPSKKEAK